MQDRDRLYIDGAWVPSTGSGTIDVVNATTEEVMGRVPEGTPEDIDRAVQAGWPAMVMGSYVDIANQFRFEEQIGNSLVVREPLGVVGCITPWNYPLHQIVAKVAPALAAGCTVILKPSEVAPLNAFILAEII